MINELPPGALPPGMNPVPPPAQGTVVLDPTGSHPGPRAEPVTPAPATQPVVPAPRAQPPAPAPATPGPSASTTPGLAEPAVASLAPAPEPPAVVAPAAEPPAEAAPPVNPQP